MVRLFYVLNGQRREDVVPFWEAKWRNKQLLLAGAAVYWTEFC